MSKPWKYTLAFLSASVILVFAAAFTFPDDKLHLVFCDVGQGDAILIYKKSTQILIDGGPDNKVLSCLSRHLPFWDRKIEFVVLTHPDLDHYGGLVDVVRRYKVGHFASNGIEKEDEGFRVLKTEIETEIETEGMREVVMERGDGVRLGRVEMTALWPPEDGRGINSASTNSASTNEYSLVFRLSYGDFDALLTGDIVPPASDEVAERIEDVRGWLKGGKGRIEVLKVPHHGSKNGLTEGLLEAVKPQLAVISVGKNNRYGHPHKEVIELLSDKAINKVCCFAIKTLRTDEDGEVEIVSDGKKWWIVN